MRTITYPSGGTRIETSFSEGRIQSVAGTAVVAQYYSYDLDPDENFALRQCINYGSPNSPRFSKSWTDMVGRTFKTSRPGFTGQGPSVERNYYDDTTAPTPGVS